MLVPHLRNYTDIQWTTRQQHHFYVDEATKRSTWVHPYDDPEFLRTLPKDHPAHPDSKEARAVRKYSEDEELSKRKRKEIKSVKGDSKAGIVGTSAEKEGSDGERNWFQRKKDKLIGTKEEREKAKAEKKRLKEEQKKRVQVSSLRAQKDILLMTSSGARRSIPQKT